MTLLHNIPLKKKIIGIIVLTSCITLLIHSISVMTTNLIDTRKLMLNELNSLAELIGNNLVGSLLFNDTNTAGEALVFLKSRKNIISAGVFLPSGELFSSYQRDDQSGQDNISNFDKVKSVASDKLLEDEYEILDSSIHIFKEIPYDNTILGYIFIESDRKAWQQRKLMHFYIFASVFLLSSAIAYMIAYFLQTIISAPIYKLLRLMRAVTEKQDYGVRAEASGKDEFTTLNKGFNSMLTQIETREKELIEYRDHLEEQVTIRTEQLSRANKAKSEFLANMSHEIRTPMNAILGYAQVLNRSNLEEDQVKAVNTIYRSGNHLLRLINDILDISKIEAGAMQNNPSDFDLVELIQEIKDMFKLRCQKKNLRLVAQNLNVDFRSVRGDHKKLSQILINLLGNAIKFTEQGEITLRVEESKSNHYKFSVLDTGPGISPEAQKEIFSAFHQGQAGYHSGGTGLGLSIVSNLVSIIGGEIKLDSSVGEGSCFYFEVDLPQARGKVIKKQKLNFNIAHIESDHEIIALVVDDIEENRDVLSDVLTKVGIKAIGAENGKIALEQIQKHQPDIVFMDIRMPVMDGLEAISYIRKTYQDSISCVAITASALEKEQFLQSGFDYFVCKPFEVEKILQSLKECLKVTFSDQDKTRGLSKSPIDPIEDITEKSSIDFNKIELPIEVYSKLLQASELGQAQDIEEFIKQTNEHYPENIAFTKLIAHHLKDYDFDSILDLLKLIKAPQ